MDRLSALGDPHRILAVALLLGGALGTHEPGAGRETASAPAPAERIQLQFSLDAGLRAFYDDVPGLEQRVASAIAAVFQGNEGTRFWSIEPVPALAAPDQGLTVELVVKNGALRVRLRVKSSFLVEQSGVAEWTGRLVDPGELARTTTAGVPRDSEVAPLVQAALERLLAANRVPVRNAIWAGFPLGRITHQVPPSEEGGHFVCVLPIDATDERNCCLKTSAFDIRCRSERNEDTRLDTFGTGHSSDYPPSPETPPDQRVHGLKVELEAIRFGLKKEDEPLGAAHSAVVRTIRLKLFFLRRLNEDSDECRTLGGNRDLAVAVEEGGS